MPLQPVHSVSDADPGLDALGGCGILFNLFSQGSHEDSQRGEITVERIPPNGIRKIGVRQCFAYVFAEQAQKFVFDRCQGQFFSIEVGRSCGKIHPEVTVFKNM